MPTLISFYETKSVKERILANLKTTLGLIKKANGYSTDVQSVLRFRAAPPDVLVYPTLMVVGVKEDKKAIEGSPSRMEVELTVEIQCIYSKDSVQDSEEAHNLILKDIEASLQLDVYRGVDANGKKNARETTTIGTDFEVIQAERPWCISTLTARILFMHGREDPTRSW